MKLNKQGAFLVNFVIDFANGDIIRWEFDLDYSVYVIEYFPAFEQEDPCLSWKFPDTIECTYSVCSWIPDDSFQDAISNAVDRFLGTAPKTDIF